jgi:hypothetical protein
VSQASAVATPGVLGPGVKGFKPEMDKLRERMRGLGLSYDEIAIEVSRRYPVRPRQAYRLAWGWTLDKVAERFNEVAAREGTDPSGRAGMSSPHLCELERWPESNRKPSVYVLCLLARVYETDVLRLLDLADHESLSQHDRLVLMRPRRSETPFGERVLALAECGVSLPELAPWAPCDVSSPGGQAATGEGMTLTLPYVPARLVIEVSASAAPAHAEHGGGQLALVGGTLGQARAEAAGR